MYHPAELVRAVVLPLIWAVLMASPVAPSSALPLAFAIDQRACTQCFQSEKKMQNFKKKKSKKI